MGSNASVPGIAYRTEWTMVPARTGAVCTVSCAAVLTGAAAYARLGNWARQHRRSAAVGAPESSIDPKGRQGASWFAAVDADRAALDTAPVGIVGAIHGLLAHASRRARADGGQSCRRVALGALL